MNKTFALFSSILLLGQLSFTENAVAQPSIDAAYVLYGQSTDLSVTPMARVIVNGTNQTCPQLQAVSAQSLPRSMTARINPDPLHFPITVCEALYPWNTAVQVVGSEVTLPKVSKNINNVALFGDTGCKPSHQDCDLSSQNWPFPALIEESAQSSTTPDVILHMGDYNYSGTPGNITINGVGQVQVYDAGDNTYQGLCRIPGGYYGQNSVGSDSPDSWQHWQTDFFAAAKPMMSKAPWIFARGNHELCSRAGPGWFYLLDPNSTLLGQYQQQLSCPSTQNISPQVLSEPYLLDFEGLNVLVVDSANACDYGLLHADEYVNQYAMVNGLMSANNDKDQSWLHMHRPLWGVDGLDAGGSCGGDSQQHCYVNQTMQKAISQQPLDDAFDLVVSGHMHRFQVVDFHAKKHPDQLVVGNSGVKMSSLHPKHTETLKIDGHKATVMGAKKFGYMSITLDGQHWQGQLLSPQGSQVLFQCDSTKRPLCQAVKH